MARWPRPSTSRTSASNSGLSGVTTPFAAARLDRADRRMPPCGRTMTSEEFKMKKLHISRALRAALIGVAVIGSAGIARADIKDYKFELVDQSVQAGPDKVVAVRLTNIKTGKTVPNAVIFATPLDMAPDGMQEMATTVAVVPGGEPGS